ncbi:Hypothetical predicted protein [Lecanosticta acicola]|uniref:Uncharacterized protein n=1 Tax=Lecanosticta acicola TaxID=111012 RepID=A0AAI8Z1X5_9PEZI|nr:Hypothetical predicted protein [Lecanosticta acicola]
MAGTKKTSDSVVARADEQRNAPSEKEAPASKTSKTSKKRAASPDGEASPLPAKKAKLTQPTAKPTKKRSAPADEESHVSGPVKKAKRASKCVQVKQEELSPAAYPSGIPQVKLEPLSEEAEPEQTSSSSFAGETPALVDQTQSEADNLEDLFVDPLDQAKPTPAEGTDPNSAPVPTQEEQEKEKEKEEEEEEEEEEEDDGYDPAEVALLQTLIADEQTAVAAAPPSPDKLISFDELLWRAARAGEIRGRAPPASRYPATASEFHIDGSLSVLPRPANWNHIYCPRCYTWGSNCFYNVQGCVYQRYVMPVNLGGWCGGECGYCAVIFDAAQR